MDFRKKINFWKRRKKKPKLQATHWPLISEETAYITFRGSVLLT
jgi:hypothetical protein